VDFVAVVDQAIALLRQRGRLTYRTLQLQFQLDDAHLAALTDELIKGQRLATDEDGAVLVWTGDTATPGSPASPASVPAPPPAAPVPPDAERRQLTILFCDLVASTALSRQLDPEDYRAVVRAYQEACAPVIERFSGHVAQYLGDGLLVYFGYPLAHEDDAQRAIRAGLAMIAAMGALATRLEQHGVQLAIRVGIHTGPVVVGEMGAGGRREQLALGETPNVAARLEGLAAPNTVVISAAVQQLVQGYFVCDDLGAPAIKGVEIPFQVYRVVGESGVQSRLEVTSPRGLTPLVGREAEVAMLRDRWAQVKDGLGQVVLLSGEAGIGKSRLVQVLKDHLTGEPHTLFECRCSPYHINSALYPMIDLWQRVLRFETAETPADKLHRLEQMLAHAHLPLAEMGPLLAALLALPDERYPPLALTPQQHKQKTLEALLALLVERAAQEPLLLIVEDLHWVDPSTLEFLSLLVDQGPMARILSLLTFRPDFSPPWTRRAHLTQVTLSRLPRQQATELLGRVAHGKALPAEVVEQVVAKTDGVPLFVEELTKMVLESGLLHERAERYELIGPLPPLAIPTTLHDSLMARLDRLATVKGLAQLGATLGREFAYDLLQAVSSWDEESLQQGLQRLVEAEFLYQQGFPPQATYRFKHALIQDAAYQSLLKSTRQQHHQHIAQVLEARFPDLCVTQPELLAQHYTEAGLLALAIPYWQRAGQRASDRSAHVEAIVHLTRGLEVLATLPDTPERAQHELGLQIALGPVVMVMKGYADPETARIYTRARTLCQHLEETSQMFPALWGLWLFYTMRGELRTAREMGEQLLALAERGHDPLQLVQACHALGPTLFWLGDLGPAQERLAQAMAHYTPQQHRASLRYGGHDPGWCCRSYAAWTLCVRGYPDQALAQEQEALRLAQELAHPFTLTAALACAARLSQLRREGQAAQAQAEAAMSLASTHGFPVQLAQEKMIRGWALTMQGQEEAGIAQMHAGLANGAELYRAYQLLYLADAYGRAGQAAEGLHLLAEARAAIPPGEGRFYEAELSRLEGALLLARSSERQSEAEQCFHQALTVACRQQAKALELRAAMSLSRLWQQQGKCTEARELLAPIYSWFTEGFDTADLQEAKALLEELVG
jgi:class 3 adenylate cyclase/predicted ATPase